MKKLQEYCNYFSNVNCQCLPTGICINGNIWPHWERVLLPPPWECRLVFPAFVPLSQRSFTTTDRAGEREGGREGDEKRRRIRDKTRCGLSGVQGSGPVLQSCVGRLLARKSRFPMILVLNFNKPCSALVLVIHQHMYYPDIDKWLKCTYLQITCTFVNVWYYPMQCWLIT